MAEAVENPHLLRGILCALAGGICWGFSGTCAQLLMNEYGVPAEWITCVRMVIAAVFFIVLTAVKDWRGLVAVFRDRRSLLQIAAFAIFGVLLTQMSYLNAIKFTGAGTGTVLQQLGLVVIMLYVCLRTKRPPRLREVIGLVFALLGTVIIATQGNLSELAISDKGLFWGFVSAIGLAFYTLMPMRVLKKWGAMLVTGLAMLFGGSAASVVVQPWAIPVELSAGALATLVAIVLIGTLGAYMLYLQGVSDAGPVRASLLCCVEPVSAMVIAFFWLNTEVSVWDVVGCVCILVMIFLVTEHEASPKKVYHSQSTELVSSKGDLLSALKDPPLFAGRASVLGYYTSRPAVREDFERVSELLREGQKTFAELGIDVGRKKYPSSRRLMHSIKNRTTHVVEDVHGNMIAVFAVSFSIEKNYEGAIEGAWLTDTFALPQPYAELHWVSVAPEARRRGVGMFVLETADHIARVQKRISLRGDSYEQNEPLQRMLQKHGYTHCGIIVVKDAFGRKRRRVAFERLL